MTFLLLWISDLPLFRLNMPVRKLCVQAKYLFPLLFILKLFIPFCISLLNSDVAENIKLNLCRESIKHRFLTSQAAGS